MKTTARTALLVLLAAACQNTNKPPRGYDNEALVTGRLAEVNPVDVVVLPVENETGRTDLPLDEIRSRIHEGLVKRRYSPLGLDYVDAHRGPVEAASPSPYAPGSLDEQGVLQLHLTQWDDKLLSSHGRLTVSGTIYLLDAQPGSSGEALWGGPVSREVDVNLERQTNFSRPELVNRATAKFVEDVLASLPPRDPRR